MSEINISSKDNLFENGVANIKNVLENNNLESILGWKLKQIYDEDISLPETPSVAVLFDSSRMQLREASNLTRRRYTYNLRYSIWYYHSELDANFRHKEITWRMWQLANILNVNVTLNGFVPSLGSEVEVVRFRPRMTYGGVIMASALIELVAKKLCTIEAIL